MTNPLNIRIDIQGGACPYQAEGVLLVAGEKYLFYFRFRSDHAQFYVWEPGYAHEYFDDTHMLFHRQKFPVTKIPHNGYLEHDKAKEFITAWAEEFIDENTWYCSECRTVVARFGKGTPDGPFYCEKCECVFCPEHLDNHRHRGDP